MRSRKRTTPINPICSFNTAYDGQGFVAMADGWYATCIITLDKLPRVMAVIDILLQICMHFSSFVMALSTKENFCGVRAICMQTVEYN